MLASLLASLIVLGPGVGAIEDGPRFSPPPVESGYDLREHWDDVWRRFEDRHGRPDSRGPLLQPAPELQGPEYELTLAVAEHPLYLERDWNLSARGGRVYIHSDDEFSFFNQVRVKERIPMGRVAALGLRYDRVELREIKSSLFQLEFAFPDIRGTGVFVEIRPIARFEKPDLDLELIVGWTRARQGRIQTRLFFLDPFNNASDALAQNRGAEQELRVVQRNPSVGISTEAEWWLHRRLRAQLYVGGLVPSSAGYTYADPEIADRERTHWSVLGGGWLEWGLPAVPLWMGASGTVVATQQEDRDALGELWRTEPEREARARVYMLAHLDRDSVGRWLGRGRLDIELSGSYRRTDLPKSDSEYGGAPRDRSWLGTLRAQWMPTRVFGFELGYLVLDRQAQAQPGGETELVDFLSETNHRLSTRFALAFDPHVRLTFGVGWDLDSLGAAYDQGGMSLTARW